VVEVFLAADGCGHEGADLADVDGVADDAFRSDDVVVSEVTVATSSSATNAFFARCFID
jgi:hypothetical protein